MSSRGSACPSPDGALGGRPCGRDALGVSGCARITNFAADDFSDRETVMHKLFAAVVALALMGMGPVAQAQQENSTEIEQNGDWVDRNDSGIGGAGVDESVGDTPQAEPIDNRHLPNRDEFGTGFNDNDRDDAEGTGGAGMDGEGSQPGMDGESSQPGMEGEPDTGGAGTGDGLGTEGTGGTGSDLGTDGTGGTGSDLGTDGTGGTGGSGSDLGTEGTGGTGGTGSDLGTGGTGGSGQSPSGSVGPTDSMTDDERREGWDPNRAGTPMGKGSTTINGRPLGSLGIDITSEEAAQ